VSDHKPFQSSQDRKINEEEVYEENESPSKTLDRERNDEAVTKTVKDSEWSKGRRGSRRRRVGVVDELIF
jgi:hypothetical protein